MFKTLRGGQVDLKIVYGFTLFIVAQTLAWYQLNSQFVWKFWEGKAILSAIIFSVHYKMKLEKKDVYGFYYR